MHATRQVSPTAPLILWLAVQLIALGIGALGLPLSAKSVRPAEVLAVHIVVVVQISAAAALWPMLFRGLRGSAVTVATALPFLQAAGFLSATPAQRTVSAGALVVLWLATLAALPEIRSETMNLVTRAVVVVLSAGLGILTYMAAEFTPPQSPTTATGLIAWVLGGLAGPLGTFPWICSGGGFILVLLARRLIRRPRQASA